MRLFCFVADQVAPCANCFKLIDSFRGLVWWSSGENDSVKLIFSFPGRQVASTGKRGKKDLCIEDRPWPRPQKPAGARKGAEGLPRYIQCRICYKGRV